MKISIICPRGLGSRKCNRTNRSAALKDELIHNGVNVRAKAASFKARQVILPSVNTLNTFIKSKLVKPGLNDSIIATVKKGVSNKSDAYKKCVFVFDEMSIKPCLTYDLKNDIVIGFEDTGSNNGSYSICE